MKHRPPWRLSLRSLETAANKATPFWWHNLCFKLDAGWNPAVARYIAACVDHVRANALERVDRELLQQAIDEVSVLDRHGHAKAGGDLATEIVKRYDELVGWEA